MFKKHKIFICIRCEADYCVNCSDAEASDLYCSAHCERLSNPLLNNDTGVDIEEYDA